MKRGGISLIGPVLAGLALAGGCAAQTAPASREVPSPAVTPVIPSQWAGDWVPYDTPSYRQFGAVTVTADTLRFARGLAWTLTRKGGVLVITRARRGRGVKDPRPCGEGSEPRAVVLESSSDPHPGALRISVYEEATGPGPDPGFQPHRCIQMYYVRP